MKYPINYKKLVKSKHMLQNLKIDMGKINPDIKGLKSNDVLSGLQWPCPNINLWLVFWLEPWIWIEIWLNELYIFFHLISYIYMRIPHAILIQAIVVFLLIISALENICYNYQIYIIQLTCTQKGQSIYRVTDFHRLSEFNWINMRCMYSDTNFELLCINPG